MNVAKPKKGQTVAIFGLGAVGLAVSDTHKDISFPFDLQIVEILKLKLMNVCKIT